MISARILAIPIMCAGLGASILHAGDFSTYRGLQFGVTLPEAAKQAGTKLADARTVHQRPAVIQELDWQPRPPVLADPVKADPVKADPVKADPVKGGLLCFFNGELFRIVVTYDRYKVEGMTAEDMIEGISAIYGTATRPTAEIRYHSDYGDVARVIARWEDPQYSYNLIKSGDGHSFAMVLYSKRVDALAQAAIAEAIRLDKQEAPQRELTEQKKRDEEEHVLLEKARSANKPNFRP